MDKVKDIGYAVFVKHLFWTLSVIVILMLVAGWWMSSGKLKGEYDTNFTKVDTTKKTITTINSKQDNQIFNETSHAGMKEMNAQRRIDVYLAWHKKYAKQRSEVLVWPEGLSKRFRSEIDKLLNGRPIEEVEQKTDGTDHLAFQLREEYRNEIKTLLPKLAETINAEWRPTAASSRVATSRIVGQPGVVPRGSTFGGGEGFGSRHSGEGLPDGEMLPTKEYAVWWNPQDQGEIKATHFGFAESEELPTTPEILYSMEDYWVLKALMQIIERTNRDEETGRAADLPHRAAIREIHSIHIGASAKSEGKVFAAAPPVGEGEAGAEGVPPPTTQAATPPPSPEGMVTTEGTQSTTPAGPDPIEGRYVDKNYNPLAAATVRSAATSDSNPDEAYLAVAKRMPVRMRVKIDQRKLNKFLIECGNADLMLEVKQVRVNPDASDSFPVGGSSSRGGGGQFGGGQFGGGQGFSGGGFGGGMGGPSNDVKYPWDVVVDVYGIMYIFNPPSDKRLESGLEADEVEKFKSEIAKATATAKPAGPAASGAGVGESAPPAGETEATPPPADKPPVTQPPPAEAAKAETPPAAAG